MMKLLLFLFLLLALINRMNTMAIVDLAPNETPFTISGIYTVTQMSDSFPDFSSSTKYAISVWVQKLGWGTTYDTVMRLNTDKM